MDKYDIIIIGAGVAGMTAGIYSARAKKSVLIIEKTAAGGQILATTKVENYPGIDSISGQELGKKLKAQVEKFGGKFLTAEVLSVSKEDEVFKIETDDGDYYAKAVILANGSRERRLGLENEERLVGHGISYCATCDGALFKDKTIAIYGDGNTSAYSVLYLADICKKIYWIFRNPEPKAERYLCEKIQNLENVEIRTNTVISELAEDNGHLASISLKSNLDEQGITQPLEVDGLFILIGREPDNNRFSNLINLDTEGYIVSDETCKTTTEGVFCAGDSRKKPLNQLVTSTADGAVSASAAIAYLNKC